jgi:hypothetical protein
LPPVNNPCAAKPFAGKTIFGSADSAELFSASDAEKKTENGVGPPPAPPSGILADGSSVEAEVSPLLAAAPRKPGALPAAASFGSVVLGFAAEAALAACPSAFPLPPAFVFPAGMLCPLAMAARMAAVCSGETDRPDGAGSVAAAGGPAGFVGLFGLAGLDCSGRPPKVICCGSS